MSNMKCVDQLLCFGNQCEVFLLFCPPLLQNCAQVHMHEVMQVRVKPQGMASVQTMGWLEAGGWIGGRHVDHNQM